MSALNTANIIGPNPLIRKIGMKPDIQEDSELVTRAIEGDDAAAEQLFQRHRSRLRSMVAMRLDRRLASRVDREKSSRPNY